MPLQTSHSRAKVSHIIRVESESISYHAFSLTFSLSSLFTIGQWERERSAGVWNQPFKLERIAWNSFPDCLPSLALEYSSSWRTDKTSDNEASILKVHLLTLFNMNWGDWTKKQTITSISCLLAGCPNLEDAHGPVSIHQDQALPALEEITSQIQDQVSTTLESIPAPDGMSKFKHLEQVLQKKLPSPAQD